MQLVPQDELGILVSDEHLAKLNTLKAVNSELDALAMGAIEPSPRVGDDTVVTPESYREFLLQREQEIQTQLKSQSNDEPKSDNEDNHSPEHKDNESSENDGDNTSENEGGESSENEGDESSENEGDEASENEDNESFENKDNESSDHDEQYKAAIQKRDALINRLVDYAKGVKSDYLSLRNRFSDSEAKLMELKARMAEQESAKSEANESITADDTSAKKEASSDNSEESTSDDVNESTFHDADTDNKTDNPFQAVVYEKPIEHKNIQGKISVLPPLYATLLPMTKALTEQETIDDEENDVVNKSEKSTLIDYKQLSKFGNSAMARGLYGDEKAQELIDAEYGDGEYQKFLNQLR